MSEFRDITPEVQRRIVEAWRMFGFTERFWVILAGELSAED